eukprot:CAMPEP_0206007280 /NCGR_PEP_ID=MMETSP1464-20131121/5675_1 /ASSEMBLY_ACC=CAM_ASM_001124 /TAXON_ID=119497 /ORGANISM="Exanthemachrysis gayraliae, Strain RCC1523" /LENGTH=97 /DNA_ID=CAMNT_0053380773 /DNA_START=80 /DNA_END=370 /DNA_ORIENTATION=-
MAGARGAATGTEGFHDSQPEGCGGRARRAVTRGKARSAPAWAQTSTARTRRGASGEREGQKGARGARFWALKGGVGAARGAQTRRRTGGGLGGGAGG